MLRCSVPIQPCRRNPHSGPRRNRHLKNSSLCSLAMVSGAMTAFLRHSALLMFPSVRIFHGLRYRTVLTVLPGCGVNSIAFLSSYFNPDLPDIASFLPSYSRKWRSCFENCRWSLETICAPCSPNQTPGFLLSITWKNPACPANSAWTAGRTVIVLGRRRCRKTLCSFDSLPAAVV